eukprot:10041829-Ditylum_brightwellii.AAC.1
MTGFGTTENEKDIVELFKTIKSTVLRFDNKCNVYVAMANIISQSWRFYQTRDMANIVYFKKLQNLIDVAKEHRTNLGLHKEVLKREAVNPNIPSQDEKKMTKAKFLGMYSF